MNEHNIDNFMKLATNGSSSADDYYRKVYEKIASGQKLSWNWCAFLFSVSWCLYRKMYAYGILLFVFQYVYVTGVESITIHVMGATSSAGLKILFRIIFCLIQHIPDIFLGFIGNWLYVQQIHKKIDQGYHLSNVRNTDKLTWSFSTILVIVFVIGIIVFHGLSAIMNDWMQYIPTVLDLLLISSLGFVIVMYDKQKLKAALDARALTKTEVPEG